MRRGIKSETGETMECLQCCGKHLGAAKVLLEESLQGYPENYWTAIGNLSLAADHVLVKYPSLAAMIRDIRKQLEQSADFRQKIPWHTLFMQLEGKILSE